MIIDIYNNKYQSVAQICEMTSMSATMIKNILYGKTWKHVTDTLKVPLSDVAAKVINVSRSGSRNGNNKLTEEIVKQIKCEIASGLTNNLLASKYSISISTISAIRQGRIWTTI